MQPKYAPPFQQKEGTLPQDLTQYVHWFDDVNEILDTFARIADMSEYCNLIGTLSKVLRSYKDSESFDERSRSGWANQILKHQRKWGRVIGIPTRNLSPGMTYYEGSVGEYLIVEEVVKGTDLGIKLEQPQLVDCLKASKKEYQDFLRSHERYQRSLDSYVVKGRIYGQEGTVQLYEFTREPSTALVFMDPPTLSTAAEGLEVGAKYWNREKFQIETIKQFHTVKDKSWVVIALKHENSTTVTYDRIPLEDLKNLRLYKPYWGQLIEKPFGCVGILNGFALSVSSTFEQRKVELSFSEDSSSRRAKILFAEVIQNRDRIKPDWDQPSIVCGHVDESRQYDAVYKSRTYISLDVAAQFTAMLGQILKISENLEVFFKQITENEPAIEGLSDLEDATP